jgi:glycerol uptake facilitator-like aquaporin
MGTGILATGICCTMYKNPITEKQENTVMMHDIYISLTLYLCICLFAPLTGGHFNPAVSLGAFVNSLRKTIGMDGKERRKVMGVDKLAMYLIGQFIGGAIGCGLAKVMYDIGGGPFESDVEYTAYHVSVRCFGEFLGIFLK